MSSKKDPFDIYDKIASDYASFWFDNKVMEPELDKFVSLLKIDGPILDAGCGPGRDVLSLSKRGIKTIGIDISESMIKEAYLRFPNGIFEQMDVRNLTFSDEYFAGIWSCGCLQHLS